METVVIIIMAMVCFSFILKLTCHSWPGRISLGAVCALFILLTYDTATTQSKAQIADWLSTPELMLDMSVWLTIDVAFQIFYCVLAAKALTMPISRMENILMKLGLWIPGILIFPVLFAILTEMIFTMTGINFATIAWCLALAVAVMLPLLAYATSWLIPEKDIRLEMLFMVSLIIAALGIVATVNGRTAAIGTNSVEWQALAAFIALTLLAALLGLVRYRRRILSSLT